MSISLSRVNPPTPLQLVDALEGLGVSFLRGGSKSAIKMEPGALVAALAASDEARLRLALIPLWLAHPEFSVDAIAALRQLSSNAAVTLRCYYTAARWLQIKHSARLTARLVSLQPLPDLFSAELDLMANTDPDAALHALAARQQALSGRRLNWLGSYEYAAQTWLRQLEQEAQWNQLPPIRSKPS